jgi:isocitrate dehydrogenase
VLLSAGRAAEAEAIYWQDLERNRENGWSLFGLRQSLRAQGKEEQAAAVEKRFRKAWKRSNVTLTASRFMDDTHNAHTTVAATGAAVSGN